MAHPKLINHYWLSETAANERARMTATQIMMQHRAEQDARTHARKLQQAVDEEGCGAVFAALTAKA